MRTIFQMYGGGKSYNEILDALHGMRGKRGQPLGKNSIPTILSNERYIGVYTWNRRRMKLMRKWAGGKQNPKCVRIENAIPPIIDRNLWERVQIRLNNNRRNATNKAKHGYLLTGLRVYRLRRYLCWPLQYQRKGILHSVLCLRQQEPHTHLQG